MFVKFPALCEALCVCRAFQSHSQVRSYDGHVVVLLVAAYVGCRNQGSTLGIGTEVISKAVRPAVVIIDSSTSVVSPTL